MCPCKHIQSSSWFCSASGRLLLLLYVVSESWLPWILAVCLLSISLDISVFKINFIKVSRNKNKFTSDYRIWEWNEFHLGIICTSNLIFTKSLCIWYCFIFWINATKLLIQDKSMKTGFENPFLTFKSRNNKDRLCQ